MLTSMFSGFVNAILMDYEFFTKAAAVSFFPSEQIPRTMLTLPCTQKIKRDVVSCEGGPVPGSRHRDLRSCDP